MAGAIRATAGDTHVMAGAIRATVVVILDILYILGIHRMTIITMAQELQIPHRGVSTQKMSIAITPDQQIHLL